MSLRRREYRPERVAALEERAVMSQALPFPQAIAVRFGTQTHPIVTFYKEGSSRQTVLTQGGSPRLNQFAFSAKVIRSPLPDVAAIEKTNPNLNTFKVSYNNATKHSLTWVSITEKLDPNLRYVPGNEILPPGTKLALTTDYNGIETLTLTFPTGIPSGSEGYFAFQTKYRKPSF